MVEEKLVPMKEQVYTDPRPAEYFDRFHARSRSRDPDWVYEAVKMVSSLYCLTFLRARCVGSEHVPASGPVILAPNHFSYMDHFLVGAFTRRKVRFMAKSAMFKRPAQWIYSHGGVFPVRRGVRDDEAFKTANHVLGKGDTMCMYCEGGRSRTGKLADRAKPGIGRVALQTGAVIVPTAIHGSSKVRNWKRLQFPKVMVRFGEPLRFEPIPDPTRDQQQAVADEIFDRIRELYAELEQVGHATVARRVRAARRARRRQRSTATA